MRGSPQKTYLVIVEPREVPPTAEIARFGRYTACWRESELSQPRPYPGQLRRPDKAVLDFAWVQSNELIANSPPRPPHLAAHVHTHALPGQCCRPLRRSAAGPTDDAVGGIKDTDYRRPEKLLLVIIISGKISLKKKKKILVKKARF